MVEEPNKNYARLITELRESLAWMDLVLSNINEGILAVGDDLKVLFANDAIADMLDKLRITLLGIPIWDVLTLSVEDEPVLKDNFQEAFRRGNLESITGRYKLHRESKKELTVDISISPIAKTNQTILIIRDITQQLKNERALIKEQVARTQEKVKRQKTEENRRLLQSIIDGSATIIYLKDPEGRYTMINSQYKKIFGLDGSDIIGKTDFDLFSREVAEALIKNDQHVLRVKKTIKWEESITYKNDRRTYIFSKFPLLDSAGDPHSLCGILTDITARKELEDRKDTFINMASHELKTPLTSMKLYWEFTKKHITKGKAEESLYLSLIHI